MAERRAEPAEGPALSAAEGPALSAAEGERQLRLFVACELPDDVRTALGRIQDDLRRLGAGRLRWVRPEGDVEALAALAARVEAALAPLGFPREGRPFAPHLTLARVPDQAPPAERRRLSELLERYRLATQPSMVLTDVHLMQSVLGPGGSVYHRLASFPGTRWDRALDGSPDSSYNAR